VSDQSTDHAARIARFAISAMNVSHTYHFQAPNRVLYVHPSSSVCTCGVCAPVVLTPSSVCTCGPHSFIYVHLPSSVCPCVDLFAPVLLFPQSLLCFDFNFDPKLYGNDDIYKQAAQTTLMDSNDPSKGTLTIRVRCPSYNHLRLLCHQDHSLSLSVPLQGLVSVFWLLG
jgi:hypothetical protein